MKFVDQSFHVPRTPVAVVDCGATGEALLLRALLENMNAVVILHQPGTPEDFLLVLADEDAPQFIVICAHGDDNGIVFGTYAPHIDTSCLVHGSLPARAIAGSVRLPGRTVVSTACGTGSSDFARALMAGGVRAYIAPASAPEGTHVPLFLHHFFYDLLVRGASSEAADQRARDYDEESTAFLLHGHP
jgi:hypothetical protein